MRPFELWDLVDLAGLVLCFGVERSMAPWVPKWRRYWSCYAAAVSVLFLRLGDGWILPVMTGLGFAFFGWNFITAMIGMNRDMRAMKAEMVASLTRIAAMKAEIERHVGGGDNARDAH